MAVCPTRTNPANAASDIPSFGNRRRRNIIRIPLALWLRREWASDGPAPLPARRTCGRSRHAESPCRGEQTSAFTRTRDEPDQLDWKIFNRCARWDLDHE